MANIKSAKKRILTTLRNTEINKSRRSRVRTFIKKVLAAIDTGNAADAQAALQSAQPEIDRSVAKGILHKKTAARTMSRLSSKVKAVCGK